jgi:osmotically-inducible protein OsmY
MRKDQHDGTSRTGAFTPGQRRRDDASDRNASRGDGNDVHSRRTERTERGSLPYDLGDYVGTTTKGYRRSDGRILEDAQVALAHLAGVDSTDVDVSVSEGTVILTGSVPSRHDLRAIVDCAEHVSGAIDVRSQLRVEREPDLSNGGGRRHTKPSGYNPRDVA